MRLIKISNDKALLRLPWMNAESYYDNTKKYKIIVSNPTGNINHKLITIAHNPVVDFPPSDSICRKILMELNINMDDCEDITNKMGILNGVKRFIYIYI